MILTKIPYHVDIIPLLVRVEQNLILNRLKEIIDLENHKSLSDKLEDQHLPLLKRQSFLVTFNTGKPGYWLFLTRKNNRQISILINKTLNRMWFIPSTFPDQYYRDTLLEVTVISVKNPKISDENKDLFISQSDFHFLILIHDILILKGKNIINRTLAERYKEFNELFFNYHYLHESFEYSFKPHVKYEYLESLWFDLKPTLIYKNLINGLLFRPQDSSTCYFYNIPHYILRPEKIVHIKSDQRPRSLYLLVEATDTVDSYKLYALDRDKNLKYLDLALVNDLETSRKLRTDFKIITEQNEEERNKKIVYLCEYIDSFKSWRPVIKSNDRQPDVVYGLFEEFIN